MVATTTIRKKPPPPLDRGWAWMIVLGTFINAFFMVGFAKSYGLLLLKFMRHFGVTTAEAALPISISAFVYAVGAPTAILISEITSFQKVVIFGACMGLIGMAISSLLLNMGFVIVFFGVCFGIGNSCYYGNSLVMIGKYFRVRRSLATGLGLAGASIGQFAMPPLIEYLLENYGLDGTLLIIGALYFHGAISGALFRPIEQYGPEEKPQEVQAITKEEHEVLVKTTPGYSDFQEQVRSPQDKTNDVTYQEGAGNGDVYHPAPNGDAVSKEGNTYVSFEGNDFNPSSESTELVKKSQSFTSDPEIKRRSKRWSEILEEDEKAFLERKVLMASTGSIYLVSPSVLDVSDIDHMAHGVEPTTAPKSQPFFKRLFDFSVLKSYVTLFFLIVSFLCFFGYFNFILFLPPVFVERGITKYDKALLISICGAGDLIARIGAGFFADLNLIPRYQLKAAACLLSGINIFMFFFADSFAWLGAHCFLYGFLGGVYVCLMSVVLVDFVGVALMAKNLAVILLIQGMGAAIGQIFLGWISDESGSYNAVIIVCFLSMSLGALLLFFYPLVKRREEARLERISKSVQAAG